MARIVFNISKPEPVIETKLEEPIPLEEPMKERTSCANCVHADFSFLEYSFKCAARNATYRNTHLEPCEHHERINASITAEQLDTCESCDHADFTYSENQFHCDRLDTLYEKRYLSKCPFYKCTHYDQGLNGSRADSIIMDDMIEESVEENPEEKQSIEETCGNCSNALSYFVKTDLLGREVRYVYCRVQKNIFGFHKSFKRDHSCGHFKHFPSQWQEIMEDYI